MKPTEPKKILCIHDLSGMGRCSLAVILPVLSVMGCQPVALPTVVLSTHTGGLGTPARLDGAAYGLAALKHYRELGVEFDCIYTGYLGGEEQVALAEKAFDLWPAARKVVDPVMGDNGKAYSTVTPALIDRMRGLCRRADLILPNATEAALLLEREPQTDAFDDASAQALADEVGAEVIALSDIDERLKEADIIISSTASPLPIIGKGMVERALKARRNQPMLLVDIAVPRDVEPEVGKLANAYLYSVDDLQNIIQHNLAQRKAAAVQAETIVEQEASEFMAWLRAQSASETIREYRSQAEQVREELTAKALAALNQGGDAQEIMQDLARKLTNRLIHSPTKSLQQAARDGDDERLHILRNSLGLE